MKPNPHNPRSQYFSTMIGLLCAVLLSACSSFPTGTFDNRVALTIACDEAVTVHNWGPFSIGSRLSQKDADALCVLLRPAPAASGVTQ